MEILPELERDPSVLSLVHINAAVGRACRPVARDDVSFNFALAAALSDAVQRIRAVEREVALPATFVTSFLGVAPAGSALASRSCARCWRGVGPPRVLPGA